MATRIKAARKVPDDPRRAASFRLTVFVLSRNRPEMACEAVESLLASLTPATRLVVSDNSTDDRVRTELAKRHPAVEVRRRDNVDAFRHMRINLAEADTEFVVLFHDDDLVDPAFCARMIELADRYPLAVAWACNARILDVPRSEERAAFETDGRGEEIVLESPAALLARYVSRSPRGFALFPSYMYRTTVAHTVQPHVADGGKYSDVAWLMRLAGHGPIVWSSVPLITYRLHGENDGLRESLRDRLKLLAFLKRHGDLPRHLVDDWRFMIHKRCLRAGYADRAAPEMQPVRERVQRAFLRSHRARRLARAATWAGWFRRARRALRTR
jgi:glycosyltransferase involved in cell wall biosynthesis